MRDCSVPTRIPTSNGSALVKEIAHVYNGRSYQSNEGEVDVRSDRSHYVVWYIVSRLLYWAGAFCISLLTILARPTGQFTELPDLQALYFKTYDELLIVIITLTSLAIFDIFEIFRYLPQKPTGNYALTILLALTAFLLLFILTINLGTITLLKPIQELSSRDVDQGLREFPATVAANRIATLHFAWMATALFLCFCCKLIVSILEAMNTSATPSGLDEVHKRKGVARGDA